MTTEDNPRAPCGDCQGWVSGTLESAAGPLREMRAGVRLCAGVWRVIGWLLKTIFRPRWDLEVPIQKQLLCSVQRDCVGLLPFSSRRVGSARWPPCVPGASWHDCAVCAAGLQQTCARFSWLRRQVCAERWKDSSCSCCRGDQETALVLASDTEATAPRAAGTEAQVSQPR